MALKSFIIPCDFGGADKLSVYTQGTHVFINVVDRGNEATIRLSGVKLKQLHKHLKKIRNAQEVIE